MQRFPTLFTYLNDRNPSAEISSAQLEETQKETKMTEKNYLIIVIQ